jgi:hypothetical protein
MCFRWIAENPGVLEVVVKRNTPLSHALSTNT